MPGRFSSDHSRSLSQSSRSPSQNYPPNTETESMHRRSTSGRSSNNPNVFSDEYSLEPIDSEQSTLTPRSPSVSSIASSNTLRSSVPQQKPYNTVPTEPETTENPFGDEARLSFDDQHRSSLPQKGLDLNRNSVASTNTAPSITQRSQSTSSRFSMPPRALSPYTGATGPSHPYAMYPQVGVSRSPSVTTTSTVRPMDRPLGDANAPQHPYAMYPQNVVPEEGIDAPVIPLGFPGHPQAYQRPPNRADDDVGDLIGPDGHTEQLPPYSRYPENAVPKVEEQPPQPVTDAPTAPPPEAPRSEPAAIPIAEVAAAGMVAGNQASPVPVQHPEPPEEPPATGIMAFEEKLKTKGKKKACCGLPVWTLVLVGVVMLVGGCIGGVIGGVLGAKKAASEEKEKGHGPQIVTTTATPRMDATPISTIPSNLMTLPTGNYVIPAYAKNQSKFCIADSDYTRSWSCMTSGNVPISISGTQSQPNVSFKHEPFTSSFTYGAQAPFFASPTQSLSLMMDSSDLSLGPAWTFFSLFDKLVIVPQDTFPSNAASKRSIPEDEVLATSYYRKKAAQSGDKPWFCWWNSTVMEFFLYANETTKESRDSSGATLLEAEPSATSKSKATPDYPRRIKMEEKRDYPEAQAPYCQQMQVMDNGSIQTVSPATIQIKEMEPTPTTTMKGVGSMTQTYTAKAQYASVCYCVSLTD
ncbi:uncharacterized protein LDX57_001601 [Aspergillus melleus]|uniref:uncharacterized protein n=1 Tax=Aspergillus melleus TaxID=138277 RepID=UPI001E8E6896|nr:uncharacterized protein LDX57_001601 [Aspergillus melleus]KAH8423844.1 hypothetical protein LDX57_001601 [Aspergillus melleus]